MKNQLRAAKKEHKIMFKILNTKSYQYIDQEFQNVFSALECAERSEIEAQIEKDGEIIAYWFTGGAFALRGFAEGYGPMSHLNIKEAACLLGLSPVRMSQFCKEGRLGEKIGKSWDITLSELEKFWQSRNLPEQSNEEKITKWLEEKQSGYEFKTMEAVNTLNMPRTSAFVALKQLKSLVKQTPNRTQNLATWTYKGESE